MTPFTMATAAYRIWWELTLRRTALVCQLFWGSPQNMDRGCWDIRKSSRFLHMSKIFVNS